MATYYINADTGNDTTGDGSESTPWLTISKAHTEASGGDTIVVEDATATYTFSNLTFTKNLTIQGESDDASGAVFDAANASVRWKTTAADIEITFQKLTFQNGFNNIVFYVQSSNGDFTFESCIFDLKIRGIYTSSCQMFSTGNLNANITLDGCLIKNCEKHDGSDSIAIFGNTGGYAGNTFEILNTTIYPHTDLDEIIEQLSQAMTFTWTNTIVNCQAATDYVTGSVTSDATYSCFYNVTSNPTGTGVITSDPLLVDADNDNFNLRPTSPCIDTGVLV